MFGQVIAIARNTFVESVRQPIFFILIMAGAILQVMNTLLSAFTMGFTEQMEVSGDDKLLLDMGLATVMVCCTLLAAFIATSVLSREIENKTALTVISKPIGRPSFIFGKYIGVSGAILVAGIILTAFFLFAIRHKVMSNARDQIDGPVLLFAGLAIMLPIALAIWGNYFYGWVFSSTAVLWMLPAVLVAYVLTLGLSKDWEVQPLTTDLKPQIMLASACAMMAVMVLTSIALAASTRLGQVMTIVVCAGAFMLGLLSNHLLGRHAFTNSQVGIVKEIEAETGVTLRKAGDRVKVTLKSEPKSDLKPGMSVYYAPDPSGLAMTTPNFPPFQGKITETEDVYSGKYPPALIIREVAADNSFTIQSVGGGAELPVERLPKADDFIFTSPTSVSPAAFGAWAALPNLQTFWLVDAVTQGHSVPPRYVGLIGMYAGSQIVAFLALAVALFQRRDVG